MTATLLIRLAGPMQSWGAGDRFDVRFTEREPTKSGVIGLVCAALGRSRAAPVDDLAALRFGVRVDREGRIERDYHTAGSDDRGVMLARGHVAQRIVVSSRYYLADADFLAGLEGDDVESLTEIDRALRRPRWHVFLGRKSFVPSLPVALPLPGGVRHDTDLESALRSEQWPSPGRPAEDTPPERLRAVLEVRGGTGRSRSMDQPVGPAFATRRFGPRESHTEYWAVNTIPTREVV